MSELNETPMQELTDSELDLVSGGFFDFGNNVVQSNVGVQIGLAFGGGVAQLIGQSNISVI